MLTDDNIRLRHHLHLLLQRVRTEVGHSHRHFGDARQSANQRNATAGVHASASGLMCLSGAIPYEEENVRALRRGCHRQGAEVSASVHIPSLIEGAGACRRGHMSTNTHITYTTHVPPSPTHPYRSIEG